MIRILSTLAAVAALAVAAQPAAAGAARVKPKPAKPTFAEIVFTKPVDVATPTLN
jgi:type VI protein secretion system component Hcp